jgi:hypothetical protein
LSLFQTEEKTVFSGRGAIEMPYGGNIDIK